MTQATVLSLRYLTQLVRSLASQAGTGAEHEDHVGLHDLLVYHLQLLFVASVFLTAPRVVDLPDL